jgi:hypothetical protein
MGKKRRILLATLFVVGLALLAWFLLSSKHPPEPVYGGKPLRFWIDQYHSNANTIPTDAGRESAAGQAAKAIRAMGANAFPLLLEWAGNRDSALKLRLRKLIIATHWAFLTGIRLKISPSEYHYRAILAFQVFRSDGAPAVPGLLHLLGDPDDEVRLTAMQCLQLIGPPAKAAVPALVGCLKDTNIIVRHFATGALGSIHGEPEIVVPALIEILNDTNRTTAIPDVAPGSSDMSEAAIIALGKFGPEAGSAVPVLLPLLNDQSAFIRRLTTNALKKIDPATAAKAGVK